MAFSTPRALSSAQPKVFGSPAWKLPIWDGCQAEMKAPLGSWKTAILPWSPTSNGAMTTLPPAACTFFATSAASLVPM